jgi:hypothetical protein
MTAQGELSETMREMLRVIYEGRHQEFLAWCGYDLPGYARQLLAIIDKE